jgi:hypothetical protein
VHEDESPYRVVAGEKGMLGIIAEGLVWELDKPATGMALASAGLSWTCTRTAARNSVDFDDIVVGFTRRKDDFTHVQCPGMLGEDIEERLQDLGGPLSTLRGRGLLRCHFWYNVDVGCDVDGVGVGGMWVSRGKGGALRQTLRWQDGQTTGLASARVLMTFPE